GVKNVESVLEIPVVESLAAEKERTLLAADPLIGKKLVCEVQCPAEESEAMGKAATEATKGEAVFKKYDPKIEASSEGDDVTFNDVGSECSEEDGDDVGVPDHVSAKDGTECSEAATSAPLGVKVRSDCGPINPSLVVFNGLESVDLKLDNISASKENYTRHFGGKRNLARHVFDGMAVSNSPILGMDRTNQTAPSIPRGVCDVAGVEMGVDRTVVDKKDRGSVPVLDEDGTDSVFSEETCEKEDEVCTEEEEKGISDAALHDQVNVPVVNYDVSSDLAVENFDNGDLVGRKDSTLLNKQIGENMGDSVCAHQVLDIKPKPAVYSVKSHPVATKTDQVG
ncbi:hypothetical protein U1Q18_007532, partial [Sarracenia purpurea var. burkii]